MHVLLRCQDPERAAGHRQRRAPSRFGAWDSEEDARGVAATANPSRLGKRVREPSSSDGEEDGGLLTAAVCVAVQQFTPQSLVGLRLRVLFRDTGYAAGVVQAYDATRREHVGAPRQRLVRREGKQGSVITCTICGTYVI